MLPRAGELAALGDCFACASLSLFTIRIPADADEMAQIITSGQFRSLAVSLEGWTFVTLILTLLLW